MRAMVIPASALLSAATFATSAAEGACVHCGPQQVHGVVVLQQCSAPSDPGSCSEVPVQRTIRIESRRKVVKIIRARRHGHFRTSLPLGRFTLVAVPGPESETAMPHRVRVDYGESLGVTLVLRAR